MQRLKMPDRLATRKLFCNLYDVRKLQFLRSINIEGVLRMSWSDIHMLSYAWKTKMQRVEFQLSFLHCIPSKYTLLLSSYVI